jgi:hypothetical protein
MFEVLLLYNVKRIFCLDYQGFILCPGIISKDILDKFLFQLWLMLFSSVAEIDL